MPVGALGPQQSVTLPIVANVPLLSDGVYFLRAICDASQRNDELSESNNITVASARLTLEQALPDLVVESPSILDANLEAGADATLRFNLRNIGTKALTVPVNYAVRISRDAIYSPKSDALVAGTKLNFSTTSPLNVNASTVVNVPFRVPTCIDQVVYTFFVEVDSGLAVVERNEGNNLGQVAKLMLRYEGLKPVLEFTEIDDGTRVSWTAARFGPGRHNKAKICVTSRPSVGDWSMLIWSLNQASPLPDAAFQISVAAINSPIFPGWFAPFPTSGHVTAGFDWSGFTQVYNATVYAHCLVFKSDFSAFVSTGGGLVFDL